MAHMGRPGLSAAQKAELWHRWKDGQSLSEIGRALGKHAGSIHGVVSANGGLTPAVRRRSRRALTLAEREEISRGLATARSIRQIAATLGRAPSTIAEKSAAMVGLARIALLMQMGRHGSVRAAPSPVGSPPIPRFSASSRANWRWIGRQRKSRGGSNGNSPIRAPCVSPTKRSTAACSSKPEAC